MASRTEKLQVELSWWIWVLLPFRRGRVLFVIISKLIDGRFPSFDYERLQALQDEWKGRRKVKWTGLEQWTPEQQAERKKQQGRGGFLFIGKGARALAGLGKLCDEEIEKAWNDPKARVWVPTGSVEYGRLT